jgi:hypothetical protein
MSYKLTLSALAAMMLVAAGARAADGDARMFSFGGFGTLGVVHSSETQADFIANVLKPNGAGYTHDWSAAVDSLIAAQATARVTPRLSAVLQVVSEQNYDNTYKPHVEWANVRYQFTPDFSVRAGRTVLPVFLLSDTRKVGYTYPWVRPPIEIYGLSPLTNSDGLEVSYRLHVGELTATLQANLGIGTYSFNLTNGNGVVDTRHGRAITIATEYGVLTTNITYRTGRVTIPSVQPLIDAFRQFGPQGVAIAGKYNFSDSPNTTLGVGASYDPGHWFMMAEWGRADSDTTAGRRTGWYVSGGYRIGKFTPYVTYAQAKADQLSDPGLTVSALPSFLAGPAMGLNAALNSILHTNPDQNTVSVGARWDFMKNVDLKLQFDHTRIGAGSSGVLINTQPGFQLGGKVNLFSATIDFVF